MKSEGGLCDSEGMEATDMTTTVLRTRQMVCPVDGDIEIRMACCPVCTRPFEPADGASQERWGYGNVTDPEPSKVLAFCGYCPTDESDNTPAFEVAWTDDRQPSPWGTWTVVRTETARLIGVLTPEAELVRNLDEVERDLFRICFPELAS